MEQGVKLMFVELGMYGFVPNPKFTDGGDANLTEEPEEGLKICRGTNSNLLSLIGRTPSRRGL